MNSRRENDKKNVGVIYRSGVKVKEWNMFRDQRAKRKTRSEVNQRPLVKGDHPKAPNPQRPRAQNLGRNQAKRKRRNNGP